MCMEILKDKIVKTKKKHQCFGCLGIIPIGAEAKYQVWTYEGDFCHGYICSICQIVLVDADYFDGEWGEGGCYEDKEEWERAARKFEERTGTSYSSAIMPFCKQQHRA